MLKNPNVTLLLGMAALLVGNVLNFAKRWMHDDVWPDAIVGVFFGMAFGLLLLTIWQRTHAHR